MALKIGDNAPDFEIPAVEDGRNVNIKLSDYRGKKIVLVSFHPLDWTPTCAEQVPALNADRDKFAAMDVQLLDVSIDTVFSHKAWQKFEIGDIHFPMCSDFYPFGQVTRAFGIMRQELPFAGMSERAVFIVDKAGKIVFAKVYPLDQAPKSAELLEAIKGIKQ